MRKTPSNKPPHPTSEPATLAELANTASPTVLAHRQQDRGDGDGDDDSDVCRLGRTVLRFRDLQEAGVVSSWSGLGHLIREYGFPRGRHLGEHMQARARFWFADEILLWLESRPLAPVPKEQKPHSKQPTGRGRGRPKKIKPDQHNTASPESSP
jgi:hypothetical protein